MKANELRIGNLIYFDNNVIDVGIVDLNVLLNENLPLSHKHYKPIPLTEKWLLEFGFVWSNHGLRQNYFVARHQCRRPSVPSYRDW